MKIMTQESYAENRMYHFHFYPKILLKTFCSNI